MKRTFHRPRSAVLNLGNIIPADAGLGRLSVAEASPNLLLTLVWAAAGIVVSTFLAASLAADGPFTVLVLG